MTGAGGLLIALPPRRISHLSINDFLVSVPPRSSSSSPPCSLCPLARTLIDDDGRSTFLGQHLPAGVLEVSLACSFPTAIFLPSSFAFFMLQQNILALYPFFA